MSDLKMNGPAYFEMRVFVINDDTGQQGTVTVSLGSFEYPTKGKVKKHMEQVISDLESQGVRGFRLMTKQEAFAVWSKENFGQSMTLASGPEWDEI